MKKIIRYSVAYCDTPNLSAQFGTWDNCWNTLEEVRSFIKMSWNIIDNYGENAFLLSSMDWLVIEPVEFIHYNIFERLFMRKPYEIRVTPLKTQGSFFR